MSDAMTGIKEFLATVDVGSDQYTQQYPGMSQLREQLIQFLAQKDPDAALAFLQSTTPRYSPMAASPQDLLAQETALELSVATQIMEKNPNRAVQIARRSLKTGYSPNLIGIVTQLAQKNPELAREVLHEITGKLLNEEKLIARPDAANFTITLLRIFHTPADAIPLQVERAPSRSSAGLISEDEYKQLMQKAAGEVLSYTPPRMNNQHDALVYLVAGLQSLGADLDKVVSGGKAAIEKKNSELISAGNVLYNPMVEYQNAIANDPVEAALETIEKAPADYREQLYVQLANREGNNGDLARARQIVNDNVTNPYQRRQALLSIDQQETYRALAKGKVEEVLRNVSSMKSPRERAGQLMQIISQIGPGQKRATALNLLEQARALLSPSPQAQDAEQMNALFEVAHAFSRYDSKRSFEILDPLIDQFNDICVAARTMQGFGVDFYDDDELDLQNGNGIAGIVSEMSTVLGSLALVNFERAKTTTDKLRLPEVRLTIYLEIAQQTIGGRQ